MNVNKPLQGVKKILIALICFAVNGGEKFVRCKQGPVYNNS